MKRATVPLFVVGVLCMVAGVVTGVATSVRFVENATYMISTAGLMVSSGNVNPLVSYHPFILTYESILFRFGMAVILVAIVVRAVTWRPRAAARA